MAVPSPLSPRMAEELDLYIRSQQHPADWLSQTDAERINYFRKQVQQNPALQAAVADHLAGPARHDDVLGLGPGSPASANATMTAFSSRAPSTIGRAEHVVSPTRLARLKNTTWRDYVADQAAAQQLRQTHPHVHSRAPGPAQPPHPPPAPAPLACLPTHGFGRGNDEFPPKYQAQPQPQVEGGFGTVRRRRGGGAGPGHVPFRPSHVDDNHVDDNHVDANHKHNTEPKTTQEALDLFNSHMATWVHHMKRAVQAEADATYASTMVTLLSGGETKVSLRAAGDGPLLSPPPPPPPPASPTTPSGSFLRQHQQQQQQQQHTRGSSVTDDLLDLDNDTTARVGGGLDQQRLEQAIRGLGINVATGSPVPIRLTTPAWHEPGGHRQSQHG